MTISAFDHLRETKEKLFSDFSRGKVKENFQNDYSDIMDGYFATRIQESETVKYLSKKNIPFSLVAVGGYGRRELCVFSDIDILVLFDRKIPDIAVEFSRELFYPLWDLGLELGYGVRTIKDCLKLAKNDFEVLTSIMDSRFIAGTPGPSSKLLKNLQDRITDNILHKFLHWLEMNYALRMNNFGDATHLLEPDLKNGIGGLRDYHHIRWLAKALSGNLNSCGPEQRGHLSCLEYSELMEQVQFIIMVRNHLHSLSGRKNDRLSFEYQEEIAGKLGFKKIDKIPPVETFLGRLHSSMELIKIFYCSFFHVCRPEKTGEKAHAPLNDKSKGVCNVNYELSFESLSPALEDNSALMEIFVQSSMHDIPLSLEAVREVKGRLYRIDDSFRRSERIFKGFLDIINSKNGVNTFTQMFETGFLDAYIPEFGRIRNRVQFDAYHIFPVGRHSLETLYRLKNIVHENDHMLSSIFVDIENPEILFLSALFHDIGKTGNDHARRGVKITREILNRCNYDPLKIEEILFLIENHLFLAETATRRDLNDEKIIINAARITGTIPRLNALYLLTWADSMATGPRAWNDWTSNLLQELFFKILHILEKGELATPDASQKLEKLKRRLRKLAIDKMDRNELENFLEILPLRYKLVTPASNILNHYKMAVELENRINDKNSGQFVLHAGENRQGGVWEVILVAKDRPGLFSDIAGAMALNNINILSSDIYTWTNGTAVDVFSVTPPLDNINPHDTWDRVERDLKNIFSGRLALPYRLSKKKSPAVNMTFGRSSLPPEVIIDNRSSDFFTLIETFASDRVGLLYMITKTLFDLRLDIRIAKTGVKGDQTADVFYVRDFEGQKLMDNDQANEVKMALIHRLQSGLY